MSRGPQGRNIRNGKIETRITTVEFHVIRRNPNAPLFAQRKRKERERDGETEGERAEESFWRKMWGKRSEFGWTSWSRSWSRKQILRLLFANVYVPQVQGPHLHRVRFLFLSRQLALIIGTQLLIMKSIRLGFRLGSFGYFVTSYPLSFHFISFHFLSLFYFPRSKFN